MKSILLPLGFACALLSTCQLCGCQSLATYNAYPDQCYTFMPLDITSGGGGLSSGHFLPVKRTPGSRPILRSSAIPVLDRADDGIRTHTRFSPERILSPLRLPFRHIGVAMKCKLVVRWRKQLSVRSEVVTGLFAVQCAAKLQTAMARLYQ